MDHVFLTERSADKSLDTVVSREITLRAAEVRRQEIFLFSITYRHALGTTQPPLQWASALFPGGKAVGAWCWPVPCSAKVKNEWSYTSSPPYTFMTWAGTTFTFMGALSVPDRRQDDRTNLYRLLCDVLVLLYSNLSVTFLLVIFIRRS